MGGVLWELRDKWAGSLLLASNAEVGWAGCRDAGAREASRASQLQQPSTEQLECILGVAEAPLAAWGFSTKSGVVRLKTLQAGTVSFCV